MGVTHSASTGREMTGLLTLGNITWLDLDKTQWPLGCTNGHWEFSKILPSGWPKGYLAVPLLARQLTVMTVMTW